MTQKVFEYYLPLRRLQTYLSEHPNVPLSLSHAARIAGYERTYFSKFFRQKTGVGFKRWLDARRIDRAVLLLQKQDHPITTVAYECGFEDLTTFERTFHRVTGVSPSRFRESVRLSVDKSGHSQ